MNFFKKNKNTIEKNKNDVIEDKKLDFENKNFTSKKESNTSVFNSKDANDPFDEEFLDIIESDNKNKIDEVENKDFEILKNSINNLKEELNLLKEIIVNNFNSIKNKNNDFSFDTNVSSNSISYKILSDLHEQIYDNKVFLKKLDEKLSSLIDIYKEEVSVLKEQNENLKNIFEKLDSKTKNS